MPSQPHACVFPLHFDLNVVTPPNIFYAFDFGTRRLPPPPGDSYGFNVLFALSIGSKKMLAVKLAMFVFNIAANVRAISTGIKLWDLTFRVDRNYIFGTLQFETRSRHKKVEAEAYFCTNSLFVSDPDTQDVIFYRESSGLHLSDHAVSAYMTQINWCLRYVFFHCYTRLVLTQFRRDLTESGLMYEWQSYYVML